MTKKRSGDLTAAAFGSLYYSAKMRSNLGRSFAVTGLFIIRHIVSNDAGCDVHRNGAASTAWHIDLLGSEDGALDAFDHVGEETDGAIVVRHSNHGRVQRFFLRATQFALEAFYSAEYRVRMTDRSGAQVRPLDAANNTVGGVLVEDFKPTGFECAGVDGGTNAVGLHL